MSVLVLSCWEMHELLEQNRDALVGLCRRHHVRRLDVFGSIVEGGFDPSTSDLDFLVELADESPEVYAAAYFGLLEDLRALFARPVDLATDSSITNPYFRESVERTRTLLYAA
jgi:uncharacterized protein